MLAAGQIQRVWQTFQCSIYNLKSEQLPNLRITTLQIPLRKPPKPFLVWLPTNVMEVPTN